MITIRNSSGLVVQTSRNLRGIVDRARKVGIDRIDAWYDRRIGKGTLGVTFADDSYTVTDFASDTVLEGYLKRARWVRDARAVKQQELP